MGLNCCLIRRKDQTPPLFPVEASSHLILVPPTRVLSAAIHQGGKREALDDVLHPRMQLIDS